MKIVVTHTSPDWDAISSVWLIKKYLAGWQNAEVKFVPAGTKLQSKESQLDKDFDGHSSSQRQGDNPIEKLGEDEVIHVDTGLGPLDHHQTQDVNVSAASLAWDYVSSEIKKSGNGFSAEHAEAISRIVKVIVDTDHFKEVFWPEADADRYELSFLGLLDGLKYEKPDQDMLYLEFGIQCLNAWTAGFENRIWAEKEIREKGIKFETRFGSGMGFDTINDTVLKLAQKMGYVLVVRKDPRKGYVRIKALPSTSEVKGADLTLIYEQLKKIDPDATWFLHVSKKMLLNGSPKNPKMRPSKLSLGDIIKVIKKI
jgi:hypothetical protein